jgi:hypothetical protein
MTAAILDCADGPLDPVVKPRSRCRDLAVRTDALAFKDRLLAAQRACWFDFT